MKLAALPKGLTTLDPAESFHVALLVTDPLLPVRSWPACQLTVPLLTRARVLKSWSAVVEMVRVDPEGMVVVPLVLRLEPFQAVAPVSVWVPASVPPASSKLEMLTPPVTVRVLP